MKPILNKPKKQLKPESTWCRHEMHRSAYATMLELFPLEAIKDFYNSHPIHLSDRTIQGRELFKHLWKPNNLIPIAWNYEVSTAFEDFLIEHGNYDHFEFIRKVFRRNNYSTYLPGKTILSWIYPKLASAFTKADGRETIIRLIQLYTERYMPGTWHDRVCRKETGEEVVSYIGYCSSMNLDSNVLFNFELLTLPQLQFAPSMVGLPPFDSAEIYADPRRISAILPRAFQEGDSYIYEGRVIAKMGSTESHFRGFTFPRPLAKTPVFIAAEDIICPRRKRVVVTKGCAYEAPVYVSKLTYRKLPPPKDGFLHHLIGDIEREDSIFGHEIERRHEALLELAVDSENYTYYAADSSISINGNHLIRGTPAKILRYLLQSYFSEQKTHFEYREFLREYDISLGNKDPQITTPLVRLMERLEQRARCLKFTRINRGNFELVVSGNVQFVDKPAS